MQLIEKTSGADFLCHSYVTSKAQLYCVCYQALSKSAKAAVPPSSAAFFFVPCYTILNVVHEYKYDSSGKFHSCQV